MRRASRTDTMKIKLFSNRNSPQIPPKIKNLKSPPPKIKRSQIKIASAHIPIPRNNPAKLHNNQMDSLGGVADNRFRTDVYVRTGREDKGNLIVCPASLKAGHNNNTHEIEHSLLNSPIIISHYAFHFISTDLADNS